MDMRHEKDGKAEAHLRGVEIKKIDGDMRKGGRGD